jgi:transposase
MDRAIIGVDPHKKSVTFEARDSREIPRATGSFPTDAGGCRLLIRYARQWPERIWAVEGANGIGRPLARRLLASGERVLDVPAKLAARAPVFDTGQGRKTDAADAHAIAMVALRDKGLRKVTSDPELAVLRLLCDRRDELSRAQALNRMHRLFLELVPGGAPVKKSASQCKALLASVRPHDPAGKMRRRMAAEELADIEHLDARLKAMKAALKTAVLATGSHLMDLHGIGPAGAARILADVGDIARFPSRGHFASWNGTAPTDASSGQHIRHRLSRAGNRRINHVLYMAGIVQLRNDTKGRRYYRRRLADGKTPMEAMRALRRRISDAVYRQLARDARERAGQAGPGGHSGASMSSSAADLTPVIGSSDQPLPGPASPTLPPATNGGKTSGPGTGATPRRRSRGVNVERPTGRTTLTPASAGASSQASRTRY